MALLGRRLATPPVVWKKTEEDGNLSVVLLAFVLLSIFSSLLESIGKAVALP
jgi:hypothetical protein